MHLVGSQKSLRRPFFLYDASISYISEGDTVPAAVAVLTPFLSLFVFICCYEFWVFKLVNWHISNAVATVMHFMLDSLCALVTAKHSQRPQNWLLADSAQISFSNASPTSVGQVELLSWECRTMHHVPVTASMTAERASALDMHPQAWYLLRTTWCICYGQVCTEIFRWCACPKCVRGQYSSCLDACKVARLQGMHTVLWSIMTPSRQKSYGHRCMHVARLARIATCVLQLDAF